MAAEPVDLTLMRMQHIDKRLSNLEARVDELLDRTRSAREIASAAVKESERTQLANDMLMERVKRIEQRLEISDG